MDASIGRATFERMSPELPSFTADEDFLLVLGRAGGTRINLECLYGDGPAGHPFLCERADPAKFLLGL